MAKSFYITDEYIDPLSKAFHLSDNLRKLDLSRTNLSKNNCKKLILHLPENLESVNFSHNLEFGPENVSLFCSEILDDPRFMLESFIIEECNIGDKGFVEIGKSLSHNQNLRYLDISNNGITFKGTIDFCIHFSTNQFLQILFMHWNLIGHKGGKALA